ncbi:YfgM family protein [Citrobacter sp. JGM124]|uniref:YfgM family protein n=1 Tax=Citrobacter sp. JGM124 TaxID=2799789 RepID=UPI001BAD78E5|nr:YfgM family protein [Citrobacter sp. JGM124]
MEVFENENDQVEAVKRFFAENGKALIVGVVLGIGALVGWRFWGNHQAENASAASLAYQTISSKVQADKPETLEALQAFAGENKGIYGSLASLELAQQYADKNELEKAATQLESGLGNTKDVNLQALIDLRLARVQIQQKQSDAALKTLDNIKGESWAALVADLRGEALLSKGDKQGARDAWSQGLLTKSSPALIEMLQIKINNLSS